MKRTAFVLLISVSGLVGSRAHAQSTTIYVDPTISVTSCTNYSPDTRACGSGTATAYNSLAGGGSAATPGTVVSVRQGSYGAFTVPGSGTSSQPVTYRRFGSETVTVTGSSIVGITMTNREYVEIDGFTVTDVTGWVRLQDSRYITIRNSTFRRATSTGTTGSIKLVRTTYSRILSNVIEDGNDNIVLVDAADRNVIQGNTISTARHSLLSVRCSNDNVFRSNTLSNPNQKAIEIYDCEGVGSDSPIRYDAAKRNMFELNQVTRTRTDTQDNHYNGIQHGAQQTIVRQNVFRNNDGGGVNYQYYTNESRYVYGNRMYNNTFYANRCHAIIGDTTMEPDKYKDNRVKNNLLYKNVTCSGAATQVNIADPSLVILTNNALETTDPGFVDEAANNFQLASGSRMIDAGAALTQTASAGSGTSMPVQDVLFFYAGNGVTGEVGDEIQLLGGSATARITAIDYGTNTLTLNAPLTWGAGAGVALRFNGAAPDMGAFESGVAQPPPPLPSAPTNLRIVP